VVTAGNLCGSGNVLFVKGEDLMSDMRLSCRDVIKKPSE
jgi:hypothetical protein